MKITRAPHPFVEDPDVPRDHLGNTYCHTCHLVGRAGDNRHDMPTAPTDAHRLAAGDKPEVDQ